MLGLVKFGPLNHPANGWRHSEPFSAYGIGKPTVLESHAHAVPSFRIDITSANLG
jgi:hypothetical protein